MNFAPLALINLNLQGSCEQRPNVLCRFVIYHEHSYSGPPGGLVEMLEPFRWLEPCGMETSFSAATLVLNCRAVTSQICDKEDWPGLAETSSVGSFTSHVWQQRIAHIMSARNQQNCAGCCCLLEHLVTGSGDYHATESTH